MERLFLQVINMTITSSYVILFIIAVRMILKRAPRIFSYGLWSVAFLRLVLPFSFESIFSLVSINTKTIPENIAYAPKPQIQSGIRVIDGAVNRVLPAAHAEASVNPMEIWISIGSIIWLLGLIILLFYCIYITFRFSGKLKSARHLYANVYEIHSIDIPFLFGLFKPKIYIPKNLSESEIPYIIKHEEIHIRRKDHLIKFAAYLITIIHWFNPLVWLAFYLMNEDMELSCDEAVIRELGYGIKKDYSKSLLSLSVERSSLGASPIAFGENKTRSRIKNILNYKRPKFWVIIITTIVIIILAIGLLSNPSDDIGAIDNNYVNEKYEFYFEVPENWKYKVIEDGNIIRFLYSGYESEYGGYQEFFTIAIVSKEEYIRALSDPPMTGIYLAEKDNLVYILNMPLDCIIFDREKVEEYNEMVLSVDEIKERFYLNPSDSIRNHPGENLTIEDYAWVYIDNQIQIYESAAWGDFKFVDKEITRLEKVSTFDHILPSTVELWKLEYRLKPERTEGIVLADGMSIEDGWLVDYSNMGRPYLTFTYDNGRLVYLGNANIQEFELDTLANQETAIRIMLENMGILRGESYEGEHVVIKFPLSTGETSQLLLSQPLIKGERGIWVVERWMDGNGNIYLATPQGEEDVEAEDYYRSLQEESQRGALRLLDPVEVGYDYIINQLGQRLVKKSHLLVINPATLDDFLETPVSHYIGYITMMTLEDRIFHLDRVEFLTMEDEERIAELNIDVNVDMPSGFYIYNKDNYPTSLEVLDSTQYLLLDWTDLSRHNRVTKEDFIEYNNSLEYTPLYHVYTKDGYVTIIEEQYIP